MPQEDQTLQLEPNRVYLTIYCNEEGVIFEATDTFSGNTEDSMFVACVARGLVEMGLHNIEEVVRLGTKAFVDEGVMVRREPVTITEDGKAVDFPKTEGNA